MKRVLNFHLITILYIEKFQILKEGSEQQSIYFVRKNIRFFDYGRSLKLNVHLLKFNQTSVSLMETNL